MKNTNHGGERAGAGRKKTAEKRISARLDSHTVQGLKEFDLDLSATDAVRLAVDYAMASMTTSRIEEIAPNVFARFRPVRIGQPFKERVINAYSNTTFWMYRTGLGGRTVKANIPLGDGTSAWVVYGDDPSRLTPPTALERADQERKIEQAVSQCLGVEVRLSGPTGLASSVAPKYTLDELLAASDYSRPQPASEREWIDAPVHGNETL